MCLIHNLMVLYNNELENGGLRNTPEEKRRAGRLEKRTQKVTKAQRQMPTIISGFQRLTQRSVKLVRWFRHFMWVNKPLAQMHARLRILYAEL